MISGGRFRKEERILKSKDFRNIYKKAPAVKDGGIVFLWLANGRTINRIGFSISARSIRSAVRRNRIKRLFREAYRRKKTEFSTGFDIVLAIKRNPPGLTSLAAAEKILSGMINKARIGRS